MAKYIAKTFQGLEQVLAEELKNLDAQNIQILNRAVSFSGDKRLMYRANLELRTALRIIQPIRQFKVRNELNLYKRIREIDWSQFMTVKQTLAVNAVTNSNYFKHSKYVALKTKDAIVDQFRDKFDRRPNVNVLSPSLRIDVHIFDQQATVSIDTTGESLHKRGYRIATGEAPINEVLAAGMILLSNWQKDCNFIDPMCGSGTILIEAASYALNIAPAINRKAFGFMKRVDFDKALWEKVVLESKQRQTDFHHKIIGSDTNFGVIRKAQTNIEAAGLSEFIEVKRKGLEKLIPPEERGLIMMNPPYDERLQLKEVEAFYKMIGDQLKQKFTDYDAWIISANLSAMKNIGLRSSKKFTLFNGPLECKFQKFELYAGSKKSKNGNASLDES